MAKKAKKKTPNFINEAQKADIRHNKALELKKKSLDIKLNITLGIVIGAVFVMFLFLPTLNMNFSGSLSEFLGNMIQEENDQTMGITVNMTFIDILFAMTKGYSNSIEYIAANNSSDISPTILKTAFAMKATKEEIKALDGAYIVSFVLAILLFLSMIVLLAVTAIKRRKNQDGVSLSIAVALFSAFAILQWIVFLAVGIGAASKGQIQPHIASYSILAAAVALSAVYGAYKSKVKKIEADKRVVKTAKNKGER